jgi:4-hydroxy-3-polyprenylbenzoate decarboxylase
MPMAKKVLAMKPKMVNKAPCQEIVKLKNDINLFDLPIQECWPNEPAPLITWGLVATKEPSFNDSDEKMTGSTNLGVYRMQVKDKNKLLMRWLKHRGGAQHFKKWQEINGNKPMPCAVVIGCDPATILSAVTPVPDNLSEYLYSGLLRDKKLELVKCKTIPLEVPANAEIILEGFIYPDKLENEGPYGDHTGYYNSVEKFPTFELSAITMRKDPIYLSTYTGKPIDEPSIISLALNEVFTPLIIQQFPEIIDFYLPPEGCSYRIAVVSIKKTYAGQAKRIMMGIWSYLRQFLYTKYIIVVDGDINIRDWKEIMWAISTKTDPSRDMIILDDTPIDYLDFASVKEGLGGKMGIDATNKIFPETTRQWGDTLSMDNKTIKKIDEIWDKIAPEEL